MELLGDLRHLSIGLGLRIRIPELQQDFGIGKCGLEIRDELEQGLVPVEFLGDPTPLIGVVP